MRNIDDSRNPLRQVSVLRLEHMCGAVIYKLNLTFFRTHNRIVERPYLYTSMLNWNDPTSKYLISSFLLPKPSQHDSNPLLD